MLGRRRRLIIVTVVAVTVVVFLGSHLLPSRYSSTASVLFNTSQIGQQLAGISSDASATASQTDQDTNVALLGISDVAMRTASVVGQGYTRRSITDAISIQAVGDTNLVDVTATAKSPALAAQIANTYVDQFVEINASTSRSVYSSALKVVTDQISRMSPSERSSAAGIDLQTRAQSLSLLAALSSTTARVAQAALVPESRSSPQPFRYAAIAALMALFLAIAMAYVLEALDTKIHNTDQIERLFGVPVLGEIPRSRRLSEGAWSGDARVALAETQAFQLIHAHLKYFNVDKRLRTILVTSAIARDGKSTVAVQLAASASASGSRVLLIDCDVRRSTSARRLHVKASPGLIDVITSDTTLAQVIQTVTVEDGDSGEPGETTFGVVVAGAIVPNPTQLIASHAMAELLSVAKSDFDLVVVDVPPITVVPDAIPLLSQVDGVIAVVRPGNDKKGSLGRLFEILGRVGAPTLGVVANATRSAGESYYYAPAEPVDQSS